MTANQPLDDPETYAIIGAAMAVHTELGCGFLEAVYKAKAHEAITAIDLAQAINYLRRRAVPSGAAPQFRRHQPDAPAGRVGRHWGTAARAAGFIP